MGLRTHLEPVAGLMLQQVLHPVCCIQELPVGCRARWLAAGLAPVDDALALPGNQRLKLQEQQQQQR